MALKLQIIPTKSLQKMSKIQQQLSQYLLAERQAQQIANNEAQIDQVDVNSALTVYESSMCLFYQLGLTFVNIMMIVTIVLAYIEPTYEQGGEKYAIWVTMGIAGVIGLFWAIFGCCKEYLSPFWAIFWGHYAVGLLFVVYVMITKSVITLLWSLLASAIIFVVAQIWFLRTTYYLIMTIFINGLCVTFIADLILRKQDIPIKLSYSLCISLIILTIIGTWILVKYMKNNWALMFKAEKYFCYCMIYLCVLAYCVCFIGFFSLTPLPWPVLTIPNFVIYLLICRYFHKIWPDAEKYHPKKVLSFFKNAFSQNNNQSLKKQKLFQVSLCLLCSEQDYVQNARDSVIGRPLSQCVCCLSQQSTFCYYSCKHACLGIQCAANWLQKNVRKCPICRMESNFVVRVQRIDHVQFNVIGKYKFKNNQL